jgi:hypothetical protein
MCIGRKIISALLTLVISSAPDVAFAASCCCLTPVEQQPACCIADAPAVPQPVHECCVKSDVAPAPSGQRIIPGCCCIKAVPPAVPSDRTPLLTVLDSLALPALLDVAAFESVETPWLSVLSFPGSQFPDEPPASVRLCVWLK